MSLSWLSIVISILAMAISAYNCYKSYSFRKTFMEERPEVYDWFKLVGPIKLLDIEDLYSKKADDICTKGEK